MTIATVSREISIEKETEVIDLIPGAVCYDCGATRSSARLVLARKNSEFHAEVGDERVCILCFRCRPKFKGQYSLFEGKIKIVQSTGLV